MDRREDLAEELTAMLGASRELTADTDRYLAERFLDRLDAPPVRRSRPRRVHRTHRRRWWGAGLVGAVALALSAPFAFRSPDGSSAMMGGPVMHAIPACSWQVQTLHFKSAGSADRWEQTTSPKTNMELLRWTEFNGTVSMRIQHWQCAGKPSVPIPAKPQAPTMP